MTTSPKPRSVTSPGAPDRIKDPATRKRANPDGATPAELPTVTPSVPTGPAPKTESKAKAKA